MLSGNCNQYSFGKMLQAKKATTPEEWKYKVNEYVNEAVQYVRSRGPGQECNNFST